MKDIVIFYGIVALVAAVALYLILVKGKKKELPSSEEETGKLDMSRFWKRAGFSLISVDLAIAAFISVALWFPTNTTLIKIVGYCAVGLVIVITIMGIGRVNRK